MKMPQFAKFANKIASTRKVTSRSPYAGMQGTPSEHLVKAEHAAKHAALNAPAVVAADPVEPVAVRGVEPGQAAEAASAAASAREADREAKAAKAVQPNQVEEMQMAPEPEPVEEKTASSSVVDKVAALGTAEKSVVSSRAPTVRT